MAFPAFQETCMLADQIQTDLTAAMKARDELRLSVLRMALAAIKEAKVSGDEVRDLSDEEVVALLAKEAKRRDEAAEAFAAGGREESAARELAERDVLAAYLPAPVSDEEIAALVDEEKAKAQKLVDAGTPRGQVYDKIMADAEEKPGP